MFLVVDPDGNKLNPDGVFPNNNWFSIHENYTKVLYQCAQNRRNERKRRGFKILEQKYSYKIKNTIDLTFYESKNLFLEKELEI